MKHEFYMNLAIQEAWKYQILTYPNPAVGCCLLDKNGAILEIFAHQKAGEVHAELGAIKRALEKDLQIQISDHPQEAYDFILKHHNNFFKDASLYVTLEPCSHFGKTPSCASLLSQLGFKKIFIALKEEDELASCGAELLKKAKIELEFGLLEEEAKLLLEPFLKWQKGNFSFLKVALSQNGAYEGKITNSQSLEFCHKLRDKVDLLVIGGNTVRCDKPTLDTRYIKNGKNPDVLIYSKRKDFDKELPLFKVPNRKVELSSSLEQAFSKNLVMFEGTGNFLELLKDKVDYFLLFHSNEFKNAQNVKVDLKLKLLYSGHCGDDLYSWYKKAL